MNDPSRNELFIASKPILNGRASDRLSPLPLLFLPFTKSAKLDRKVAVSNSAPTTAGTVPPTMRLTSTGMFRNSTPVWKKSKFDGGVHIEPANILGDRHKFDFCTSAKIPVYAHIVMVPLVATCEFVPVSSFSSCSTCTRFLPIRCFGYSGPFAHDR